MSTKSKEFQLNELVSFKNEIIHFFNVDGINSTINIYLEIDGKRAKSVKSKIYFHKLILNEIGIRPVKKEVNCFIVDDVELKILIRIISKYKKYFRRKSRSFDNGEFKIKKRVRKYNYHDSVLIPEGTNIKDKIKIFSGEYIKRKIDNKIYLPRKLIMPKIFENEPNKEGGGEEGKNTIKLEEIKDENNGNYE